MAVRASGDVPMLPTGIDDERQRARALWVLAPQLDLVRAEAGRTSRTRFLRGAIQGWRDLRAWSSERSTFVVSDGVLFVHLTVNQRLAVEPVATEIADRAGLDAIDASRTPTLRTTVRQALRWDITEPLRSVRPVDPYRLGRLTAHAAAGADTVRRLRSTLDLRCVVTSSQHSVTARAAIVEARSGGLPSVYIPHAPLVDDPRYHDLPTSHAGLRGMPEVTHYTDLGANARLRAIGNASVAQLTLVDEPRRPTIIVAVSPDPENELRDFLAMVAGGIDGSATVVLAPHPRSDLAGLRRLLPTGWTIARERTLHVLQRGASAVIQRSSGVAWEAMAMGIPTIDVRVRPSDPGYVFLRDGDVLAASSTEEVEARLAEIQTARSSIVAAQRRLARAWCAAEGHSAAQLGADLVDAACDEGQRGPLVDRWTGDRALEMLLKPDAVP